MIQESYTHTSGDEILEQIQVVVQVFRRHICFSTFSGTLLCSGDMVPSLDEVFVEGDV